MAYRVFLFREYVDGRVGREVGTLVSSEIHFCQREGETDAFYRGRDEIPGSGIRVENDREDEGYFVCRFRRSDLSGYEVRRFFDGRVYHECNGRHVSPEDDDRHGEPVEFQGNFFRDS